MANSLDLALLGRQPILDRQHKLVGFELLFRNSSTNAAHITDDTAATATVIARAFTELGLQATLGDGLGFINCNAAILLSDAIEVLPRDRIVLEILESVAPSPEIVARCKALHAMGFTLALDDYSGAEATYRELLALVDFIKVDLPPLLQGDALSQVVARLKPLRVPLLAEKVDSREQAERCAALGFELFQGYFFAKPTILSGRKLARNELALLRLLGQVLGDAETHEIEATLKLDAGLTVNLLRLVNSVASGVRSPVQSLRQAITVLGRQALQRWLQLLLFTQNTGASPEHNPLLNLAATRGRLLELLCAPNKPLQEEAFLAGVLSLMPSLMGCPMHEVLQALPVSPALRGALLEGSGHLGALLQLAASLESPEESEILKALQNFPQLSAADVLAAQAAAMAWSSQIGRQAQS